ncbi:MAG: selenium metabolism-associated LysR family transcriptional regulator [Treponemataceae bacterium]|nr:MAG: selenium metabolism-associated LysR family transcriptional regulator [Treponemataceae bacterium]
MHCPVRPNFGGISEAQLNFAKLRSFCAVVETGSFSKAAEILYYTQPAVSKQIDALEAELGYPLLERDGKKFTPNKNGLLVFNFGKQIQRDFTQLKEKLEELNAGTKKEIRFGSTNHFGIYLVPRLLSVFKRHYPDIPVHLYVDFFPDILNQLDQGIISFAFLPESQSILSTSRYLCRTFYQDEMLLVFPPGHPLAKLAEVSSARLTEYPFLISQKKSGAREFIETRLRQMGINMENCIDLYSAEGVKHGIINGMGISLLPYHTVHFEISQGILSFARISDMSLLRNFYLVHLNGKSLSASDTLFIELAFENAAAGIFKKNEPAEAKPDAPS